MKHLRRLIPYFLRYRGRYAAGILLVLAGTAIAVVIPILIKSAIDGLESGASPGFIGSIALGLVACALFRGVLMFFGRYTIISTARHAEYDLRNDLFRKLMGLPAPFFDRHSSGDLASRVINDIEGVRMLLGVSVMILTGTSLLFVFSISVMFVLEPGLAALCLIPLSLVIVSTAILSRSIYRYSAEVQGRLGGISTIAQENFTGARLVRAYAQEDRESEKFSEASGAYMIASLSLARTRAVLYGLMAFFVSLTLAITLLYGGSGIIAGTFTKGEFVAFTAYQFMLVWPVIAIGWVVSLFHRGAACMERLVEILDAPGADEGSSPNETPPQAGRIEVRDLTFRYTDDRPPALRGVSFQIAPGQRIALVGRTGSGKSTLVQILLGLYRPERGHVFLDDRDINDYSRHALRDAIGAVTQDTFLFSDALRDNISFGGRNGVTDEMIRHAADVSRISVDAERFPDGLAQVVGERGITLSGGQKQRAAIARAVIRKPSILLLDDALSSVDAHTEREILEGLDKFLRGRTCLIVTQRFSVTTLVDRILVMDDGRIVEEGTHEELLQKRGLYAQLAERQRLVEELSQ